MNKEEIRTRLAGYRPEIYDDDDPQVAEALRLARQDPELAEWLENEIAFDRQFASALGNAPSDQGEIETLLSAAEEERAAQPRKGKPIGLLLAAAAVLLIGAMATKFFLFPSPVQFPAVPTATIPLFRDHMAFFANQRFILDESTSDLEKARTWLKERDFPVYANTPERIAKFKGMGCKAIDWNGRQVGLVCFLNDHRDVVHLFIVRIADLAGDESPELASLKAVRDLQTQGWRDKDHAYLFVGSDPDVSLAGLL